MGTEGQSERERAVLWAETARDGFVDSAGYLRSLPPADWKGPTGCSAWTVHDLAGHMVGEAVWFANLARGVTHGEAALPGQVYEDLKALPMAEIANRTAAAGWAIAHTIQEASPDQLQQTVDLGWTRLPLWRACSISMDEGVYHNWDARVGRDPAAVIPTPWAQRMAQIMPWFGPRVARRAAPGVQGRYLLQVADGVGPVTIVTAASGTAVDPGAAGTPDVTLHLTADQYVRLIGGRFPVREAIARGDVRVEGDPERAADLNLIFRGIG